MNKYTFEEIKKAAAALGAVECPSVDLTPPSWYGPDGSYIGNADEMVEKYKSQQKAG